MVKVGRCSVHPQECGGGDLAVERRTHSRDDGTQRSGQGGRRLRDERARSRSRLALWQVRFDLRRFVRDPEQHHLQEHPRASRDDATRLSTMAALTEEQALLKEQAKNWANDEAPVAYPTLFPSGH